MTKIIVAVAGTVATLVAPLLALSTPATANATCPPGQVPAAPNYPRAQNGCAPLPPPQNYNPAPAPPSYYPGRS
jgi:hypothetical protein